MKKQESSSLVNIANLKAQLARYLRIVRSGKQLIVTDHRQPVARLIPYEALGVFETIKPKGPFLEVSQTEIRPLKDISSTEALLKERGNR
jgi:prevent-host-death family protein